MTTRTRAERALLIAAALLLATAALAQRPAAGSCAAEVGREAAGALIRDCLSVDPATPALCRPQASCAVLRETIADACRLPGAEARPVCAALEEDDDDDE